MIPAGQVPPAGRCLGRREKRPARVVFSQLRAERLNRKWGLEDLSSASGVAISRLSEYERGLAKPTEKNLARIANALGREVAEVASWFPVASVFLPDSLDLAALRWAIDRLGDQPMTQEDENQYARLHTLADRCQGLAAADEGQS